MQADIITILGPTASGKTTLAAHLAAKLGNAEIISADSRQVYKGMDIGTGKDLADYTVSPQSTVNSQQSTIKVPYHLIDIAEAGEKYNLFQYQQDFWHTYYNIIGRGKLPILCGGTGLYIESVLKSYKMVPVPENASLRKQLEDYSLEQLTEILRQYKTLHNTTDVDTPKRAIRAIEIQEFYRQNNIQEREFPQVKSLTIGVNIDRELRRKKITDRLHKRLEEENMVHEVQNLLEKVAPEDLIYYGLEYKYLTLYCIGQLSYEEMVSQLEIAIHQFAKRQMTWFRGMERRGIQIHWIDALLPMEEKVNRILELMNEN
ncbi:MAG: tRNA (adenosine(37)-N6)-dimethylallyltransferase MiaA [Bacteroidaceae bacterium]|nr:tRNA (adenosine(37)-N6)-dimethylallyltransferase MiaA [Bacteroidaceae bacterium]